IFEEYAQNYESWIPYSKQRQYLNEGILGSPLTVLAAQLAPVEAALITQGKTTEDVKTALQAVIAARDEFIKAEDLTSDENIVATVAKMFFENVDKNQHPIGFYEGIKHAYGNLKEDSTFKKWAKDVFAKT